MDCAWTRATVTWTQSFLRRPSVPFWRPPVHGNRADKPERTKKNDFNMSAAARLLDSPDKQIYFLGCGGIFFFVVMQSLLLFFCEIISQLVLAIRHGQDKCQRREVWTVTADILTCYNKRRASALWFINVSCISSQVHGESMLSLTPVLLLLIKHVSC